MSLEATAEALVPESTPVADLEPIETQVEAPSDDSGEADMDAIYDRLMGDDDADTDEPETEPAAEEPKAEESDAEETEAEPKPATDAPTDLPASIRELWADVPEKAQAAILDAQRESARKLAHQGRLMQGINPIKTALETAAKDMPALMNMKPDEIAADVLSLAKVSADFKTKPVETIMGLIQQHGLQDKVAAAFGQQPQGNTGQLQAEIVRLNDTIKQMADPSYIRSQFDGFYQERSNLDTVSEFSATAEHWADIEPYLPDVIPLARNKLGEGASPQDVLSSAYDMALKIYLPEKADAPKAALQAAPVQDPEKAQAAIAAKSVNVVSRSGTKPRPLTEDEAMDAAYDRAMKS